MPRVPGQAALESGCRIGRNSADGSGTNRGQLTRVAGGLPGKTPCTARLRLTRTTAGRVIRWTKPPRTARRMRSVPRRSVGGAKPASRGRNPPARRLPQKVKLRSCSDRLPAHLRRVFGWGPRVSFQRASVASTWAPPTLHLPHSRNPSTGCRTVALRWIRTVALRGWTGTRLPPTDNAPVRQKEPLQPAKPPLTRGSRSFDGSRAEVSRARRARFAEAGQ
jgi:hypothetical protein